MFNDFITKLTETLTALNVTDIDKYIDDFTARYSALRQSNKSEFESVMALGDPTANAYAIAGVEYTAEEQIKSSLGLKNEFAADNAGRNESDAIEQDDDAPAILSIGEKAFYWVFVIIALALEIALYFIAAITGIVSFSYLIIAFMHFSAGAAWAVFGLAVIGMITFLIFTVAATVILKRIYLFAKKLIKA